VKTIILFLWIGLQLLLAEAAGQSVGNPYVAAIAASKSPLAQTLTELYEKNDHRSFWLGEANTQKLNTLLDLLDDPFFNYKHKPFNRPRIDRLLDQVGSDIQPDGIREQLDVALTDAYLRLLRFVRIGDVDWALVRKKMARLKAKQDVRATWEITPKKMPATDGIYTALKTGKLYNFLEVQVPQIAQYKLLVNMLEKYRNMPDLKKVPYGKLLKPHSFDERIRLIKKRLHFFGDYTRSDTGSGWSDDLTRAVRRFKERFNLAKGDYIDNKTILYLNKPKEFYLRKIITNLDILKLYPRSFASEYVEVNVPDYRLRYYRNGRTIFRSPVVVGRIDRPTPIFSDKIEYMVLNPTWTITDNLVRRDLIPVLKSDPNYLQTHNIHVFSGDKEVPLDRNRLFRAAKKGTIPYRFVQYPGDKNALGRVKFMFPNRYAVYLHDTDNKTLFQYRYRVFSSGCMRVGKPFEFMRLLLQHAKGKFNDAALKRIFASNEPTTIKLAKPIPVHILYRTAYHEEDKDYFLYDIYMYEQMIYESSAGHTKPTFTVPKKRLTGIKRVGRIHRDKKR
jgi:murein L,D-transpeptidase YcbB/YkuD